MKKEMFIKILLIIGMFFITNSVYAKNVYYVNNRGVEMTELQYIKMKDLFSERKVSVLTQAEFDQYKDANIVDSKTVYQKVSYQDGKIIDEELISESEYNGIDENDVNIRPLNDDAGYIQTTYKRLDGTLVQSGTRFSLVGALSWKKMPACRSYDVFAYRFNHFDYSGFTGSQIYFKGSQGYTISYDTSSAGYKAQDTGAGVSMNLKDDTDITGFELTVGTLLTINTSSYTQAHAYVSYQHAQNDVTRAQSMSYTLSIGGLGSVVYFSDTYIRNQYDGMTGVHLTTPI